MTNESCREKQERSSPLSRSSLNLFFWPASSEADFIVAEKQKVRKKVRMEASLPILQGMNINDSQALDCEWIQLSEIALDNK